MRTEVYEDGALVEWWGVDGDQWVRCVGGEEVERRPATPDELAADDPRPETPDIIALADRVAAMNEALDFLILESLGGL